MVRTAGRSRGSSTSRAAVDMLVFLLFAAASTVALPHASASVDLLAPNVSETDLFSEVLRM